jgi:hypothetical protein
MSRDDIRKAILDSKPQTRLIKVFGVEVEMRQSTVKDVLGSVTDRSGQENMDRSEAFAKLIIAHCYVPGTNERVFSEEDVDVLKNMPFGKELNDIQGAINDLMGIDIAAALKNSRMTPSASA